MRYEKSIKSKTVKVRNAEFPKIVDTVGAVQGADLARSGRIAIARDGRILAVELPREGVCVCEREVKKKAS